jgi:UDP-N-acetylmuramoylalanine--D-glutamate ligase
MIDLSSLKSNKPVAVFGLGVSGMTSLKALVQSGFDVFAWDDNEDKRNAAIAYGAKICDLVQDMPADLSFLVLSPGVPLTHPKPHEVVLKAQSRGIEILSDIELLYRANPKATYIGITGTNGKSTTTALIGHILKLTDNHKVEVGGNIGTPALALNGLDESDIYVLELSSYQVDLCPTFKPDISILLNITPDHLERHGGIDGYANTKAKIFGPNSYNIIAADDIYCQNILKSLPPENTQSFTMNDSLDIDLTNLPCLRGVHNIQNAMAAYFACKKAGLSNDQIENGLRSFAGLKHRQNLVRTINGVAYINDSKATNDEASAKALSSFDAPIFWIVGGQSKGPEYPACRPYFERVKTAFIIGEDTDDLKRYLSTHNVNFEVCHTMDTAVEKSYLAAAKGATVLLSPAAASWDQYKNFEHRGDHFEKLVNQLNGGIK